MSFDAIFSGQPPSSKPAGAATVAFGVDTFTGALWNTALGGWTPTSVASAKGTAKAQTGASASVLSFTVPVTGLYRVVGLVDQATATNGTPGAVQIAYTNADSGVAVAAASITTPAATTGIGQGQSGTAIVLALAGTTITVSALAPTTLTQNVYARVEFLS